LGEDTGRTPYLDRAWLQCQLSLMAVPTAVVVAGLARHRAQQTTDTCQVWVAPAGVALQRALHMLSAGQVRFLRLVSLVFTLGSALPAL
jgi:hypothetical protein